MTTLYEISQQRERAEQRSYDPYADGAMDALKRAAVKARRRNIALLGSVATWRDGKIVYDTQP